MPKSYITGYALTGRVYIDGIELLPDRSQRVVNHSPDGFAWGYGGSGPSQLALAIMIAFCGEEIAKQYYQDFKWEFIAKAEKDKNLEIEISKVKEWIDNLDIEPKEIEQDEQFFVE